MIRKHQIGIFLKDPTGEYVRIKKSTELTLSMNPETEDMDYIADENPTTELKKYKPSLSQPLTMLENEADFKFIWDKFYNMAVGDSAKVDTMLVFMFDGTPSDGYKAWETTSVLSFNDLNGVDSQINFDVLFGGEIKKGTATMAAGKPTFAENAAE